MSKRNLNPQQAETSKSAQKFTPIGQDVPVEGFEVSPNQIKLGKIAAKGSPEDSMNLKGDSNPPKIGPVKGGLDINYKIQIEEIVSKKK